MLLEPQAAAWAAEHRSEEDVVALKAVQDEMTGQAAQAGALPYAQFAQRDGQLHHLIAGASGNESLQESITRLHPHLHLFRLQYRTTVTRDALDEHAEIVEAIAAGDAKAAPRGDEEPPQARTAPPRPLVPLSAGPGPRCCS